jgi:hypothetical protein
MAGTVPAASEVPARVWPDLSSEPLEPVDQSHPLQSNGCRGLSPHPGGASAGVPGTFVRTAGTRRSVTFVTEQRMTGTVPAPRGASAGVPGTFVRTAGTRRSVTFVTEQRMTGIVPAPRGCQRGCAWIFRQNRWNLQISHIRYRATDDGDCPRIFGSSSAGVAGSFVRTAGTCRSLTSVTARPGDGDCPRSFGSGSAGVAGSFVRTAGTRRSVTFVTEQRMTGTVPAASGVAARVWLDLSSEPLEPADRSHPLQRDPVTGTVPAPRGCQRGCAWNFRQNRWNLQIGHIRYSATR